MLTMSKQWKLTVACAALGFLVAAFFFIFVGVLGIVDGTFYTAMVVLVPLPFYLLP